ncbi:Platelet-activating factor acetylhydrolase IB subunit gamma [Paramuricea clavata]|uniref:Platelet-activating factor acetylhydrolase IB subunit gamma n=1 Tax=Paramuricea clavata TaxID=317549 RepID=A0A6S7ICH7_PARCT|nr:Platelet-activating factor acetylhydrolase IB subunit gamma [Paramuricea clavata]
MSNPAAVAVPVQDAGDGRWMSMHNRFIREAKNMSSKCELLFIGDSMIHQLLEKQIWDQLFEPLGSLNFGIGGDSTQHVLWRIQNGELEHITPKVFLKRYLNHCSQWGNSTMKKDSVCCFTIDAISIYKQTVWDPNVDQYAGFIIDRAVNPADPDTLASETLTSIPSC